MIFKTCREKIESNWLCGILFRGWLWRPLRWSDLWARTWTKRWTLGDDLSLDCGQVTWLSWATVSKCVNKRLDYMIFFKAPSCRKTVLFLKACISRRQQANISHFSWVSRSSGWCLQRDLRPTAYSLLKTKLQADKPVTKEWSPHRKNTIVLFPNTIYFGNKVPLRSQDMNINIPCINQMGLALRINHFSNPFKKLAHEKPEKQNKT